MKTTLLTEVTVRHEQGVYGRAERGGVMKLNKIYCCATVPLMCLFAYGGVSQQEREFLSKYNAIEMRSSCGNSFGATGDHPSRSAIF